MRRTSLPNITLHAHPQRLQVHYQKLRLLNFFRLARFERMYISYTNCFMTFLGRYGSSKPTCKQTWEDRRAIQTVDDRRLVQYNHNSMLQVLQILFHKWNSYISCFCDSVTSQNINIQHTTPVNSTANVGEMRTTTWTNCDTANRLDFQVEMPKCKRVYAISHSLSK